jgi:hypothetical protein
MKVTMAEEKEGMESEVRRRVEEEKEKMEGEWREERARVERERSERLAEKDSEHQRVLEERVENVEKVWQKKLAARETELQREFDYKVKIIMAELRQSAPVTPAAPSSSDKGQAGEVISVERHKELLEKAEGEVREQVTQEYQRVRNKHFSVGGFFEEQKLSVRYR